MNALRLLTVGLLLVGLTSCLPAEDKADGNKEKLVGVWEVVKAEQGALPVGAVVDFAKDGKAKVTAVREGKESTAEGTYVVDGTKLTVTLKHGEKDVKHAITIKKLTDTEFVSENEKGKIAEFKRKK
jgi:uncharacterized protein (TIGR03066 family)